jgi:hypothetical protein
MTLPLAARVTLGKSTPALLDRAADLAMAEAFASTGDRADQLFLLATLARAVAGAQRELDAYRAKVGVSFLHVNGFRFCAAQDHERTIVQSLADVRCDPPPPSRKT